MSVIERANITEYGTMGRHPLSGAPAHIRAAANRHRVASGLDPILGVDELRDLERRIDGVRAEALTRAGGPGVWIDPSSRLARKGAGASRSPAVVPTEYRSTVLIVVGHGLARGHGSPGTIGKRIDRGAYGSAEQLNGEPGWTLKDGHDGFMLSMAGPALRAIPSDTVPLIVQWTPDMTRADHRAVLERIEKGERGVSANYLVEERRTMRLPQPTDVILRARLIHVALLPADEDPAFPAAFASVYRMRPNTPAELRRQVAEVEKAAQWRANQAERDGR